MFGKSTVSIFIPSITKAGHVIPVDLRRQWITECRNVFTNLFGGGTILNGTGFWEGPDAVAQEDVTIMFSFTSEKELRKYSLELRRLAERLCFALSQNCVLYTLDGQVYFQRSEALDLYEKERTQGNGCGHEPPGDLVNGYNVHNTLG